MQSEDSTKAHERKGPFLLAAFLCERMIVDKEDNYTAVQIFDQTVTTMSPEAKLPIRWTATLFLKLFSGQASGKALAVFHIYEPEGDTPFLEGKVDLDFGDKETNKMLIATAPLSIPISKPGTYRIDFTVNGAFITRIPFEIEIHTGTDGPDK